MCDAEEAEIEKLEKEITNLDQQITHLSSQGYKAEELQDHIQKLHEYNEVKDMTQIILGQLAILEGVTVKEMHKQYGLDSLE